MTEKLYAALFYIHIKVPVKRKRQIMRLVELTFLCQTLKNTKKLIVF